MITAHLQKLRRRTAISAEEEEAIRGLVVDTRRIPADQIVVHAGQELDVSLLLIDGWLARVKDLPGGDRQISELHVAGDFADLHAFVLKRLDHDVITLSDCKVAVVPHEWLDQMLSDHPRLTRVYWFSTNVDAAIHRETVLSLGQRSAIARMAHLFCELRIRLEIVGRAPNGRFDFPLSQRELGECLGLTAVHVNRTIQELRRRGLVQMENRTITIVDRAGLEEVAEFDPTYLYLRKHQF